MYTIEEQLTLLCLAFIPSDVSIAGLHSNQYGAVGHDFLHSKREQNGTVLPISVSVPSK